MPFILAVFGEFDHGKMENNTIFLQVRDHFVDGVRGISDAGRATLLRYFRAVRMQSAFVNMPPRGVIIGAPGHGTGEVKQNDQLQRLYRIGFQRRYLQSNIISAVWVGGCGLFHAEIFVFGDLLQFLAVVEFIRQHVQRQ